MGHIGTTGLQMVKKCRRKPFVKILMELYASDTSIFLENRKFQISIQLQISDSCINGHTHVESYYVLECHERINIRHRQLTWLFRGSSWLTSRWMFFPLVKKPAKKKLSFDDEKNFACPQDSHFCCVATQPLEQRCFDVLQHTNHRAGHS
jgi:hypothetical protein